MRHRLGVGKEVPTDCSINMVVGDKTYCFRGDKPKEMFMADQAKMTMKAEENFKKMKKQAATLAACAPPEPLCSGGACFFCIK